MYFFNARWYDSGLGRWAQPDSIVPIESQGIQAWDRYSFVNNNPIVYRDLSGHSVDCGMWETGCDNGEWTPSGLMNLYGNQFDLGNKINPDDKNGRQMLSNEIDVYLRRHSEYNDLDDPDLVGQDKFIYGQIRNEYWLLRANGNYGEAWNLRVFYDYHGSPQVSNWDSSRVNWGNAGLDVVTGVTAVFGMNPLAKGAKAAQAVNVVFGAAATGNSIRSGDGIGAVFNLLGFVPGPPGVVGSTGALISDLSKGLESSPYVPSIPR